MEQPIINSIEKVKSKSGFWKRFFMVMGIIFTSLIAIILLFIIFLAVTKPAGIDVLKLPAALMGGNTNANTNTPRNPNLTPQQQNFLDTLGVNTSAIGSITPAQEACAVQALGQARVDAIKAGASLTTMDYVKAGNCFK